MATLEQRIKRLEARVLRYKMYLSTGITRKDLGFKNNLNFERSIKDTEFLLIKLREEYDQSR